MTNPAISSSLNRATWRVRLTSPPNPNIYKALSRDQLAFELAGLMVVHREYGGRFFTEHVQVLKSEMHSRPPSPGPEVSEDARVLLGSAFPGGVSSSLIFENRESRVTDRAKAALDEAARAGYLVRFDGPGERLEYASVRSTAEHVLWLSQNIDKVDSIVICEVRP